MWCWQNFWGYAHLWGCREKIESALGMGIATTFVLTMAAMTAWLLETLILQPLGLGVMRILAFIIVIAAIVQVTELYIQKTSPQLYQSLGVFLPLITTNCAVLGVALLVVQEKLSFLDTLMYGFGSAIGFTVVIVLFAGLRTQLALSKVPASFQGTPIAFITAGLLSMAFMGFSGMVK